MHHPHRSLLRLFYLVSAVLLLGAGQAQARRGFMLITTGTGFSEFGKVTPEFAARTRPLDTVGWKYDYFGVFWLDIWNWGGEYCVYHDNTYDTVTKEQAAMLMGV